MRSVNMHWSTVGDITYLAQSTLRLRCFDLMAKLKDEYPDNLWEDLWNETWELALSYQCFRDGIHNRYGRSSLKDKSPINPTHYKRNL